MRTSVDYAREFWDDPTVDRSSPVALSEIIKRAQTEAYTEGERQGMDKFLNIAVSSAKRVRAHMPAPQLTDDPHHCVFNLGRQG